MKLQLGVALLVTLLLFLTTNYGYRDKEGFEAALPNPNLIPNVGGPSWGQFVVDSKLIKGLVNLSAPMNVGTTSPITITPYVAGAFAANQAYTLGGVISYNGSSYMCLAWKDARGVAYSGTYSVSPDQDKNAWVKVNTVSVPVPNPYLVLNSTGPAWGQLVVDRSYIPKIINFYDVIHVGKGLDITPVDAGTYVSNQTYGMGGIITFNGSTYMCVAWKDARGPAYSGTYGVSPDQDTYAWIQVTVIKINPPPPYFILNQTGPSWGQYTLADPIPDTITLDKVFTIGTTNPVTVKPTFVSDYSSKQTYTLGNVVIYNSLLYMCTVWDKDPRGGTFTGTINTTPDTAGTWQAITKILPKPLPNPNLITNSNLPAWRQFLVKPDLLPTSLSVNEEIKLGTTDPIIITPRDMGKYFPTRPYKLGDVVKHVNDTYICTEWTPAVGNEYIRVLGISPDKDTNIWRKITVKPAFNPPPTDVPVQSPVDSSLPRPIPGSTSNPMSISGPLATPATMALPATLEPPVSSSPYAKPNQSGNFNKQFDPATTQPVDAKGIPGIDPVIKRVSAISNPTAIGPERNPMKAPLPGFDAAQGSEGDGSECCPTESRCERTMNNKKVRNQYTYYFDPETEC
jgi:hypothetical protein